MGSEQAREQLGDLWRRASRVIERIDARHLIEHVALCRHADLIAHPERELSPDQLARFESLLARRVAGEPLAYLLGKAYFCGLEFAVSADVLIPRPDTEVLVDQALARAREFAAPRVVDLGCGSGIVAIMMAKRCPAAQVTAVDVSPGALAVARGNAQRHGVEIRFVHGDWYAPLADERFDLIVSNPPYVVAGDPHLGDLRFEPALALTDGLAGGDGLACIRALISGAPAHLSRAGWLLVEHGYDQAACVRELLRAAGFSGVDSWRDGAAIERVSGGRWP